MTKYLFAFIFSISTLLSFSQKKPTSIDLYNLGVNYLGKNEYKAADSLFTLALEAGDRNKDTYFNRALARKKLHNTCGFCVDMISAAERGDKDANIAFWRYCPRQDSVYTCEKNKNIAIKDTIVKVISFDTTCKTKRVSELSRNRGLTNSIFYYPDGKVDTFNINDQVFDLVTIQEQPKFPGGEGELFAFLRNNINYPHHERDNGIQGKVFVTFIIDKDGSVKNIELYKGVQGGAGLNQEAIRVVKLFPKWQPGKQNGKPVNVRYILPIFFKLQYPNR